MVNLLKTQRLFHLWLPNIFEDKGGIQVYSSFFLEAWQSLYPNSKYDIFLKNDTCLLPKLNFTPDTQFHFSGNFPLFLRTPAFAAQILGYGLAKRPSLVIVNHLNFAVAAYWLKQITGIPYWVIVYGIEAWNIKRPALRTALQSAERIISISNYTRDRIIKEQNLDPAKVSILPCTIDSSRFQIAPKPAYLLERYRLKSEQPVILTVCRLSSSERYKGYDRVIAALPQIRRVIPNVHYVLVGKGDDRARIEQMIAQLELQDCVTLTGFVADEELGDHYNLCDVFAMPSKGEGFGIVYLEALVSGKPTLGGNQDAAIDALCHGELGALVDPDDSEAIARTLIDILQGTYPNPLIYQPKALRQKTIATFGFARFKYTLGDYLNHYFQSNQLQGTEN